MTVKVDVEELVNGDFLVVPFKDVKEKDRLNDGFAVFFNSDEYAANRKHVKAWIVEGNNVLIEVHAHHRAFTHSKNFLNQVFAVEGNEETGIFNRIKSWQNGNKGEHAPPPRKKLVCLKFPKSIVLENDVYGDSSNAIKVMHNPFGWKFSSVKKKAAKGLEAEVITEQMQFVFAHFKVTVAKDSVSYLTREKKADDDYFSMMERMRGVSVDTDSDEDGTA